MPPEAALPGPTHTLDSTLSRADKADTDVVPLANRTGPAALDDCAIAPPAGRISDPAPGEASGGRGSAPGPGRLRDVTAGHPPAARGSPLARVCPPSQPTPPARRGSPVRPA